MRCAAILAELCCFRARIRSGWPPMRATQSPAPIATSNCRNSWNSRTRFPAQPRREDRSKATGSVSGRGSRWSRTGSLTQRSCCVRRSVYPKLRNNPQVRGRSRSRASGGGVTGRRAEGERAAAAVYTTHVGVSEKCLPKGAVRMPTYNPRAIEPRWQAFWEERKTSRTPDTSGPMGGYGTLPNHAGFAER